MKIDKRHWKEVRVSSEFDHASALEEAIRRLEVMYEKFPGTEWRMAVRKTKMRGHRQHMVWTIYCLYPR